MEVPGEDGRVTQDVGMKIGLKTVDGWLVSTLQATPDPNDSSKVKSMRQVFFWGETLAQLEQIGEGPEGYKNTSNAVVNPYNPDGTELHVYPRHQPSLLTGNIAYYRAKGPQDLTAEQIGQADLIDERLWPLGSQVWGGVNKAIARDLDHVELLIHDACSLPGPEGQEGRYYSLGRLGHDLTDRKLGRVARFGTYATRDDFPDAEPKPHKIYLGNVLYGAANGRLITTGVADRWIGVANIYRTP